MPAGRPKKPTKLTLLQGNPGKRAVNKAEPKPREGPPKPPDWLPKRAVPYWEPVARTLEEMRVVTAADVFTIAMLCDALGEWREAVAAIEKRKRMTYRSKTPKGYLMRTLPEVSIAADAMRRFNSLAAQFGLTPSARAKLSVEPKREKDPLDAMREANARRAG